MKSILCWFALALAAAGAAPPPSPSGPVVELPPMLVEGAGTSAPRWLYGRIPGFEVLSCASAEMTEDLTLRLYQLSAQLSELIPPSLQVQRDEPYTLIFYPKSRAESLSQALNERLSSGPNQKLSSGRAYAPPNLSLSDPDSVMLFSIVDDHSTAVAWNPGSVYTGGNRYDGVVFSPDYVRRLFTDRAPSLPPWFVFGISQFYTALTATEDAFEFAPDEWLSPEAVKAVHSGGAEAFRPMLPLAELFRGQPSVAQADPASREYWKLWLAESELFVRWSIDRAAHKQYQTRDGLWRFAEAAAHAPVTEELFRQCFGMGMADARDELSDGLARSVARPVVVDLGSDPELPKLKLRTALPAEIHRLKGDWARRTLRLVRESHSALLPIYFHQAREVLQGAYDGGDRDPALLADLGMLYSEDQVGVNSRRYLEEAFRGGTQRPAALAELARERMAPYLAGPGRPAPSDVERVLEPIRAARRLHPPQRMAYAVVATLCDLEPTRTTPEERALMAEGAEFFPTSTGWVITAVRQQAISGDRARALRLADLGLWNGTDPELIAKLKSVRNALQGKTTK